MAEKFLEKFLEDLIIWGDKSSCYNFYKIITSNPDYSWITELYNERLNQIASIDKTDPNYCQQLQDKLNQIPKEDVAVIDYVIRKFNLEWVKQLNIKEEKSNSKKI